MKSEERRDSVWAEETHPKRGGALYFTSLALSCFWKRGPAFYSALGWPTYVGGPDDGQLGLCVDIVVDGEWSQHLWKGQWRLQRRNETSEALKDKVGFVRWQVYSRKGKPRKKQHSYINVKIYMCTPISSKFKKKQKIKVPWGFAYLRYTGLYKCSFICVFGTNSIARGSSPPGSAHLAKRQYKDAQTCPRFLILPGFVPLAQAGKVVWELSDRSGMKVSISLSWGNRGGGGGSSSK